MNQTPVQVGEGTIVNSPIKRNFRGETINETTVKKIGVLLQKILYVPHLTYNLYSLTQFMSSGFDFLGKDGKIYVMKDDRVIYFD